MNSAALPSSRHFDLLKIADGIFAAIAGDSGAAIGNAGIVDLGNQTIIFDTFETPQAARDLRAIAEQLTGRVARIVINSHAHPDHWFGNQAFLPEAVIVSTTETRQNMMPYLEEWQASRDDLQAWQTWLQENEDLLRTETDPERARSITLTIRRIQATVTALPELNLRLPDLVFEGRLRFSGAKRDAELMTLGAGHTSSDAFLYLPQENIVFTGDLAFFQRQPYMADGNLDGWLEQLAHLENLQAEKYIPGHGAPGSARELALQAQYFQDMVEVVREKLEAGGTAESLNQLLLPEPFQDWAQDGLLLEANARCFFNYLNA